MADFTELILSRVGGQYLLVPFSAVERVSPAVRPSAAVTPGQPPRVELPGGTFPVWFGAALLGASRVVLEPSDQLLMLRGATPVALWVSAVEELLQTQIHPAFAEEAPWLQGVAHLEGRQVPVLDVDAFLNLSPQQEAASHAGS